MSNIIDLTGTVLEELRTSLGNVDENECEDFVQLLLQTKRNGNKVYCAGAGRSLLMIRAFAMRLMHLGFQSYVVGETVTPAVEKDDLVIFGSNSGETGALKSMAGKAKQIGANVAVITSKPQSTIASLADLTIEIPIQTISGEIQPSGSSFEQSMLLLCDALVLKLIVAGNFQKDETIDQLIMHLHANLE